MAKTCYWKGNTVNHYGDWAWDDSGGGATSNWLDAAGNRSAKPVSGDTVIMPAGGVSVDSDLDQHLVTLAALIRRPGCAAALGSGAAHLQINVSGTLELYGSGSVYLDGTIGTAIVSMDTPTVSFRLEVDAGKVLVLRGFGNLYPLGAVDLPDLEVGQIESESDANVTVANTFTAVAGSQWGGQAFLGMKPDSWDMKGAGRCRQSAGNAPTVTIVGDATYYYSSSAAGGTLALKARSGTFDARQAVGGFAISAASQIDAGATVYLNNSSHAVTGSFVVGGLVPAVDSGTVVTLG